MSDAWDDFSRQVFAGGTGMARPPAGWKSTREEQRPCLTIGLDMFLVDFGSGEASRDLQPGKEYRVGLVLDRYSASAPPGQHRIKLFGDTLCLRLRSGWERLIMRLDPLSPGGHEKDFQVVHLSRRELEKTCRVVFRFGVPEDCPKLRTELALDCFEPGIAPSYDFQPPSICVTLQGERSLADDTQKKSWNVALDFDVPTNWAVLHILEPGPGRLQIHGWHGRHPLENGLEVERPDLTPAVYIREKKSPGEILRRVLRFSRNSIPALQRWVARLLAEHPDDLVVVIVEHVETWVPWEMVSLGTGGYLGSRAEVVRWLALVYYGREITLMPRDELLSGHALTYLDHRSLPRMGEELAALQNLRSEQLPSTKDLVDRLLEGEIDGVALIYLACHGLLRYGEKGTVRYRQLGSLTNTSDLVTDLELDEIERFSDSLPVVVVNACHSGRLFRDEEGLYGFPLVFLSSTACGFLGTLGPVDDFFASAIGVEILQRLRKADDGVSLPAVLRDLRHRVATGFRIARASEEERLRFLFTFMYVYYGNPLTRLRIVPSPVEEEG